MVYPIQLKTAQNNFLVEEFECLPDDLATSNSDQFIIEDSILLPPQSLYLLGGILLNTRLQWVLKQSPDSTETERRASILKDVLVECPKQDVLAPRGQFHDSLEHFFSKFNDVMNAVNKFEKSTSTVIKHGILTNMFARTLAFNTVFSDPELIQLVPLDFVNNSMHELGLFFSKLGTNKNFSPEQKHKLVQMLAIPKQDILYPETYLTYLLFVDEFVTALEVSSPDNREMALRLVDLGLTDVFAGRNISLVVVSQLLEAMPLFIKSAYDSGLNETQVTALWELALKNGSSAYATIILLNKVLASSTLSSQDLIDLRHEVLTKILNKYNYTLDDKPMVNIYLDKFLQILKINFGSWTQKFQFADFLVSFGLMNYRFEILYPQTDSNGYKGLELAFRYYLDCQLALLELIPDIRMREKILRIVVETTFENDLMHTQALRYQREAMTRKNLAPVIAIIKNFLAQKYSSAEILDFFELVYKFIKEAEGIRYNYFIVLRNAEKIATQLAQLNIAPSQIADLANTVLISNLRHTHKMALMATWITEATHLLIQNGVTDPNQLVDQLKASIMAFEPKSKSASLGIADAHEHFLRTVINNLAQNDVHGLVHFYHDIEGSTSLAPAEFLAKGIAKIAPDVTNSAMQAVPFIAVEGVLIYGEASQQTKDTTHAVMGTGLLGALVYTNPLHVATLPVTGVVGVAGHQATHTLTQPLNLSKNNQEFVDNSGGILAGSYAFIKQAQWLDSKFSGFASRWQVLRATMSSQAQLLLKACANSTLPLLIILPPDQKFNTLTAENSTILN